MMANSKTLKELLAERRPALVKEWVRQIVDTYPADTRRFLKEQKDPFANPVGRTLAVETEDLLQEIVDGPDSERITPILDRIIRVRAVQGFPPSQTVAFILQLKGLVRKQLKDEIRGDRLSEEMMAFESRIDGLVLLAFDVYVGCREEIFEIRADQAQRQVSGLLRRAGLISEVPPWNPKDEEGRSPR